jgi:hypothetical protein
MLRTPLPDSLFRLGFNIPIGVESHLLSSSGNQWREFAVKGTNQN